MDCICENCNKKIDKNFDFCPFCSNPISEKAKELDEQKAINAQLVLLANLVKNVEDPDTLLILENYIKMLNQ